MTDEVVVEDWLWDDDSPEEPEERELSYEERMLRKRAIYVFVGSIVAVIAIAVLGVVSFRIINEKPVKDLPASCVNGRVTDCPATAGDGTGAKGSKGSKSGSNLPGGFDPRTGDSKTDPTTPTISKREAERRIEKCLQGQVQFCGTDG